MIWANGPINKDEVFTMTQELTSFEDVSVQAVESLYTSYGRSEDMGRTALRGNVLAVPETILVIDNGRLSGTEWPGKVSAKDMVKEGLTSEAKINEAVRRINEFYVPVNPGAKTRCIDGRHDPELNESQLGPQVPGGAPGAALAYRLGVDKDDLTKGSFLIDGEAMIDRFLRLSFAPGGHRDKNSEGGKTVGCGAIDGMAAILAAMINPSLVDDHKRVVKDLLGSTFMRDNYLRNMGAAAVLNGRSDDYFKGREGIIDILEDKVPNSTATLEGNHQECIWVVNLVPNTTLSSNRFSQTFDGMQAFGYDLWRSKQMAGRILPRPDQAEDRSRFVMARVMTTVATMIVLTDGSQRFIIRMPSEVAA